MHVQIDYQNIGAMRIRRSNVNIVRTPVNNLNGVATSLIREFFIRIISLLSSFFFLKLSVIFDDVVVQPSAQL